MSIAATIWTWAVAFAFFLAIDMIWLGFVAKNVYRSIMGEVLAAQPHWPTAFAFYILFVIGLCYFALIPGLQADSLWLTVRHAAVYGLCTYATFDLTARAVLKNFPAAIVPIDIAWGVVLSSLVASATFAVVSRWAP
jgi:uncharacterized membrane protein